MIPHLVNERLEVHAVNDELGHGFDNGAELRQRQPGHFLVLLQVEQPLHLPVAAMLKDFPEVHPDLIGNPPDGEILGVVLPRTGDGAVFAVLTGNTQAMPYRPSIQTPYHNQEIVAVDHAHVFL